MRLYRWIVALALRLQEIQNTLRLISQAQAHHGTLLQGLIERTRHMANQQDQLNELAEQGDALARIGASLTGIEGDLADILERLRAAEAGGEPLDFGPLEAVRDRIAAAAQRAADIDAQNPAPAQMPGQPTTDQPAGPAGDLPDSQVGAPPTA